MKTLSNNLIEIGFSEKGAEIIYFKVGSRDLLPEKDRFASENKNPLYYFPFVKGKRELKYTYFNKIYPILPEGFIAKQLFTVTEKSESRLTFQFKSNIETLAIFPFSFIFEVSYTLENNLLSAEIKITNTDLNEMFYQVGINPTFNLINANPNLFERGTLHINTDERIIYRKVSKDNRYINQSEEEYIKNKTLSLNPDLSDKIYYSIDDSRVRSLVYHDILKRPIFQVINSAPSKVIETNVSNNSNELSLLLSYGNNLVSDSLEKIERLKPEEDKIYKFSIYSC